MIHSHRITLRALPVMAVVVVLFLAQAAFAGVPIKGVDVKLGKNPGGGCAARTTGADGTADFGVWPKGNYTLEFVPAASGSAQAASRAQTPAVKPGAQTSLKLHVVITGAATGKIERDVDAGQSTERAVPLEFSLDGTQRLIVLVTAAD